MSPSLFWTFWSILTCTSPCIIQDTLFSTETQNTSCRPQQHPRQSYNRRLMSGLLFPSKQLGQAADQQESSAENSSSFHPGKQWNASHETSPGIASVFPQRTLTPNTSPTYFSSHEMLKFSLSPKSHSLSWHQAAHPNLCPGHNLLGPTAHHCPFPSLGEGGETCSGPPAAPTLHMWNLRVQRSSQGAPESLLCIPTTGHLPWLPLGLQLCLTCRGSPGSWATKIHE